MDIEQIHSHDGYEIRFAGEEEIVPIGLGLLVLDYSRPDFEIAEHRALMWLGGRDVDRHSESWTIETWRSYENFILKTLVWAGKNKEKLEGEVVRDGRHTNGDADTILSLQMLDFADRLDKLGEFADQILAAGVFTTEEIEALD
jgi:hypothetical protein